MEGITKGRKRSSLLTQKQQLQQRRSFLRCTTRSLVCFLALIVNAYLVILFSLINSKESSERTTIKSEIIRRKDSSSQNDDDDDDDEKNKMVAIGKANNNNNDYGRGSDENIITIGVASTVTQCGSDPFIDGAAVLKYSLDIHSAKNNNNKKNSKFKSKYIYDNIILYHPNATECVLPLKNLGFILLERPTPINIDEIQGDGGLRERIGVTGCCGEKELIKLESFRLTQYPIVIHLDLDVIISNPMDDVLDFMLNPKRFKESPELLAKIPIMWPNKTDKIIPDDISLLFTKDYNVVAPKRSDKPFQGGFFMIKPNLDTYNEFINIVRSGDYDIKKGWGNKVGPFHGGMTIQGLFPWFYEYLHPGTSVELNRCIYNNMSDKPFLERDNKMKICRTNEKVCEDCRYKNMTDVATFHFTICQKPWKCLSYKSQNPDFRLCREMNHLWYTYRSQLEVSWGRTGKGIGNLNPKHYMGYCNEGAYLPIEAPYGKAN